MAVVCWTRDTHPLQELDAYKRAFEDERGLSDLDHFELRCSPSFRRWMMARSAMARIVDDTRIDWFCGGRRWLMPYTDDLVMLDNVRVVTRDDVDGGEARLTAIRTEERAIPLLTISAVMP